MIQYNKSDYEAMLGNITEEIIETAQSCISQCTGCKCSCQCSCSRSISLDYEWEVL